MRGGARLKGQDGSLDDVDALANLVLFDGEGRGKANDVTVGGLGQQSVVTKAQTDLPGVVVWRRRQSGSVRSQPHSGIQSEDSTSAPVYFVQPTFCLLDDDGVEEAFPSDCCHDVSGQFPQLVSEQLSHPLCVLRQPLLLQHLSHCNRTVDGISCELLHQAVGVVFLGTVGRTEFNTDLKRSNGHLAGDGVAAVGGAMFPWLDGQHDVVVAEHRRHLKPHKYPFMETAKVAVTAEPSQSQHSFSKLSEV